MERRFLKIRLKSLKYCRGATARAIHSVAFYKDVDVYQAEIERYF